MEYWHAVTVGVSGCPSVGRRRICASHDITQCRTVSLYIPPPTLVSMKSSENMCLSFTKLYGEVWESFSCAGSARVHILWKFSIE
jgi:hypothetical protein